jgi:hypothetical protein
MELFLGIEELFVLHFQLDLMHLEVVDQLTLPGRCATRAGGDFFVSCFGEAAQFGQALRWRYSVCHLSAPLSFFLFITMALLNIF